MLDEIMNDIIAEQYIRNIHNQHPEVENILAMDYNTWIEFNYECRLRDNVNTKRMMTREFLDTHTNDNGLMPPTEEERLNGDAIIQAYVQQGLINGVNYL